MGRSGRGQPQQGNGRNQRDPVQTILSFWRFWQFLLISTSRPAIRRETHP